MHFVEEIYQLYPRKVGKRAALKAISYALTRLHDGEAGIPLNWDQAADALKKVTAIFSQSPAGNSARFTPHTATWFNRSSYLDDRKEWFNNEIPSKTELRIRKNRAAILAGLGISHQSGHSEPDLQDRDDAGGNPRMAGFIEGTISKPSR